MDLSLLRRRLKALLIGTTALVAAAAVGAGVTVAVSPSSLAPRPSSAFSAPPTPPVDVSPAATATP